jgi:hypothetical protein
MNKLSEKFCFLTKKNNLFLESKFQIPSLSAHRKYFRNKKNTTRMTDTSYKYGSALKTANRRRQKKQSSAALSTRHFRQVSKLQNKKVHSSQIQ